MFVIMLARDEIENHPDVDRVDVDVDNMIGIAHFNTGKVIYFELKNGRGECCEQMFDGVEFFASDDKYYSIPTAPAIAQLVLELGSVGGEVNDPESDFSDSDSDSFESTDSDASDCTRGH